MLRAVRRRSALANTEKYQRSGPRSFYNKIFSAADN